MTAEQSDALMDAVSRLGIARRCLKDLKKAQLELDAQKHAAEAEWTAADEGVKALLLSVPTIEPAPAPTTLVDPVEHSLGQWPEPEVGA